MNLLRLRSFPTRRASDLVGDAAETRGPDPAGTQLPAASATEQPPGLLEATQLTGLVPGVPLRFDPAQGWLQLDPATEIGRAHVLTPVTWPARMPPSA